MWRKRLKPSVVSISTTQKMDIRTRGRNSLPPGLRRQLPPGFEDFFDFGDSIPQQLPQREGMGSGVIVRSDGYILTNNHVVEDADELVVELSDGRKVPGKIIGTDPETDLGCGQSRSERTASSDAGQLRRHSSR